jgi:hypothetical protein
VRKHYVKAAAELIKRPPAEQARRILRKIWRVLQRVFGKRPASNMLQAKKPGDQAHPTESNKARRIAYHEAFFGYVPKRFGGRIVLLWPQDEQTEPPGPTYGWTKMCDDVHLVLVPGDNATCVERHANVGIIGKQIGRALAEIEAHSSNRAGTAR